MSAHPSPESLLQDAKLRLDTFGDNVGVLFVEGADDKRLICPRTMHRQQVVVANGRGKLLTTHALAKAAGVDGCVFLIDCDYEVSRGNLSPGESLILTEHVDIEADLFSRSGFERLVLELVPRALHDDEELVRISSVVRDRAIAFADPLGKIRRVALELA